MIIIYNEDEDEQLTKGMKKEADYVFKEIEEGRCEVMKDREGIFGGNKYVTVNISV